MKVKFCLHKPRRHIGVEVRLYSFLISTLEGGNWLA
jgi:hypothetical protein